MNHANRRPGFSLLAAPLLLGLLLGVTGCPKGSPKYKPEDLENNPAANFQSGVDLLKTPDRKTGVIDYQTAFERFEKAGNLGAGAKASFNAGWAAEHIGKSNEAEKHYRKAYDADPTYEAAMFSLARVLNEQGKDAEAVALYEAHAKKDPANADARNDYVSALIRAARFEDALKESQEILRQKPDDANVYRNLSALYYAQKNYAMSQLTAEKALGINAGDPGVYNNMGVTHLIQGDEAAAVSKFKTAIQLAPNNFEANMNLGFVALNSGDYTLAKTCFTAATEANPASADAKLGLAVSNRGVGDFKVAGELYDQIIAADTQNEAAYFNAATLHKQYTKDFAKAMKYLQMYQTAKAGTLPPTHEVFAMMEQIKAAQAEEERRKQEELEKKRAEEDRAKRNAELLATMATTITTTKAKLTANAACLDPDSVEEVSMLLEQAQEVVNAKEIDMAGDIKAMLDGYVPAIDEAIAGCAGGATPPAPAPAPAPEAPAPAPE